MAYMSFLRGRVNDYECGHGMNVTLRSEAIPDEPLLHAAGEDNVSAKVSTRRSSKERTPHQQ